MRSPLLPLVAVLTVLTHPAQAQENRAQEAAAARVREIVGEVMGNAPGAERPADDGYGHDRY